MSEIDYDELQKEMEEYIPKFRSERCIISPHNDLEGNK
jgi:hypothetical protein